MSDLGGVLVAIPTRGRRDLLPALQRLSTQIAASSTAIEVTILDNSGGVGLDGASLTARFGCGWHVVRDPGLARVRNAAIDLLQPHHRALIFLDDDEQPEPSWLSSMLTAHKLYEATVVIGPVKVETPDGAPAWLDGGRFWRSESLRDNGPTDAEAYSGNTLIDAEFLRRTSLRFDSSFDETGGEDTHFFRNLRKLGGLVVWSEDAAVIERLDPARASLVGALRRSFHAANLSWRLDRADLPRLLRAKSFVRRSGRAARGLARLALSAIQREPAAAVRGLCDFAAAVGTWSSALGWTSRYYR